MGFGLPSAIGAKVAAPEKIVVDVDGDASFSMTAMELATANQYDIGVKGFCSTTSSRVWLSNGRVSPFSPRWFLVSAPR
jgi:glyoxylate carboligase